VNLRVIDGEMQMNWGISFQVDIYVNDSILPNILDYDQNLNEFWKQRITVENYLINLQLQRTTTSSRLLIQYIYL
jgi:hypothetical protein